MREAPKTKLKPFITSTPEKPKWDSGYGGGRICPSSLADDLFKEEISGPWLCVYMLRRFGWPNAGSDDYKELMSWTLTTPVKGLYLAVTPYLGGSNLHFGIRFTNEVGRKIDYDRGRESYFKRFDKAVMGWWKTKGIKLYAWGYGLKEGDPDELVHLFVEDSKNPSKVWGLWRRTEKMKRGGQVDPKAQMQAWWISELIKKSHPEVKIPKMSKWEREARGNPFRKACEQAVQRTMLDLLRGTHVRDISFNVFGDLEKTYAKKSKMTVEPASGYWDGAGNTPGYWYSDEAKKERKKASK